MFKQVILSTTRPKTPLFFSQTPQREDSSLTDLGNDSGESHQHGARAMSHDISSSKQYLNRSLSWDIVIEGDDERYKDLRRRSKSAKIKISPRPDEDESSDLNSSKHDLWSRISEERSSQEASTIAADLQRASLTTTDQHNQIETDDSLINNGNSVVNNGNINNVTSPLVSVSLESRIYQRIHSLVQAFRNRAQRIKNLISRPLPLPSPCESPVSVMISPKESRKQSLDPDWADDDSMEPVKTCWQEVTYRWAARSLGVLDPQSYFYITWLMIVVIVYLYNCWIIFLRSTFPYQTPDNLTAFLTADYLSDAVYVIDILLFKTRRTYVDRGQVIRDVTSCRRHYLSTSQFKFDLLSLLPLDLFYLLIGSVQPILRFPRILKVQTFWEFFNTVDAIAKWPYFFRILRTLIYMMFLVHLNACAYYYVSFLEGFDANDWVYKNEGNAYIRCFYFAIRTATSISGKMPKPTNVYEYLFMTISWLLGIFVFAFLIGQIRDIVATATQNKAHFRQIMDSIIRYMESLHLPCSLKGRVRLWLTHTWDQQKLFDESSILYSLPNKIRADLAMDIHYEMLNRVDLFEECDKTVLRDIVVKLKHVLFLPGDFICRKGEVGNEMYIVSKGHVDVLRDEATGSVICSLGPGGVFGEISVLGIPGCSRRTASVVSVGFSNLFKLTKVDLWDTLRNYPEAQTILRNKAKQVMRERALRDASLSLDAPIDPEIIIKEPERVETPKLLKMVMEVVPPENSIHTILNRSRSLFARSDSPLDSPTSGLASSSCGLRYLPSLRVNLPRRSSNNSPDLSIVNEPGDDYTSGSSDCEGYHGHHNELTPEVILIGTGMG